MMQAGKYTAGKVSAKTLAAFVILLLFYTAFAYGGLHWATISGAGSPVWPASGVALAGLLLGGVRLWPAILLGRVAAALISGSDQPLWAELSIAAGNVVGTVLPVLLIRRAGGIDPCLTTLADLLKYLGYGAFVGAIVAGGIGATTLAISSRLSLAETVPVFTNWAVGNFVGALVLGPLLLSWLSQGEPIPARKLAHLGVVLTATAMLSWLVFIWEGGTFWRTWHVFPMLVWAALAFHVRGASLACAIVGAVAVWATDHGLGPIASIEIPEALHIPLGQQFVATSSLTMLILAVVANERSGKHALEQQQAQLRLAEEEARALAEEFEAVLGAVPAAIWVARDPDCREIVGNDMARSLLRLPSAQMNMSKSADAAGMLDHFRIVDGADRELSPTQMPVQRAARGEVIRDCEQSFIFDDGSRRDLIGAASPLYTPDGRVRGAVAAFMDITDRKASQARERLLAREVDHRAKNIMAVVLAAVRLTKADDIESFRSAVVGRVSSLARTHSLLADNRWDGAELHRLVTDELAPYLPVDHDGTDDEAVTVDGPEVNLLPAVAQSVALVIHELVTNAVKYGSLSSPSGRLTVTWTVEGAEPGQTLRLNWIEENGPAVTPPRKSGFGLTLIHTTVSSQLHGDMIERWDPDGLKLDISVPVDSQIRPLAPDSAAPADPTSDVPAASGRPLILLVDDEPLIAMQYEQELEDAGYAILGPASGVGEALDLLRQREPAAALVDVNLGGERSIPVAEALLSARVPFMFCTGFADTADLPDHLRHVPCVTKPIAGQALLRSVASLLKDG